MIAGLAGGSVLYLIVAVVLAVLAKLLKLRDGQEPAIERRSAGLAIPMILLAAFSYLVYYEIFGAITFQFFTKGYYPHAAEQVAAMGVWFFGYQIARGLVMTLAVLPVIYTLAAAAAAGRADCWACWCGWLAERLRSGAERDDDSHAALHPCRGNLHAEFSAGCDGYFADSAEEGGCSRFRNSQRCDRLTR